MSSSSLRRPQMSLLFYTAGLRFGVFKVKWCCVGFEIPVGARYFFNVEFQHVEV